MVVDVGCTNVKYACCFNLVDVPSTHTWLFGGYENATVAASGLMKMYLPLV
jgi:hypothetical protein